LSGEDRDEKVITTKALPGSEPFDLPVVVTALIDRRLNRRLEPAFVVVIECDEFEWLQTPGNGTQHLCRAQHRSLTGEKHQLYLRPLIQRFRQTEQSAGDRDYLQFAGHSTAVFTAENSGSGFCEGGSGRTPFGLLWEEVRHGG
jgi:hypothetical protein